MKKKLSFAHILIVVASVLAVFAFCFGIGLFNPKDIVYYEVKFDANLKGSNGTTPNAIKVLRGRKIQDLPTPTRLDSNGNEMLFLGWFKDDATSILDGGYEQSWQLGYDIVTEDLRLFALWRDPQEYPTELNIQQKAFAGSISWQQQGVGNNYSYNVYLNGVPTVGSFIVENSLVKWTPALSENIIGNYTVRVETVVNNVVKEGWTVRRTSAVNFKQYVGTGTQSDPYIISSANDILELNSYVGTVGIGEYFALNGNITAPSGSEASTFEGNFDGRGHTITINGTSGFFNRIGKTGVVANFTTDGETEDKITTAPTANTNAGLIENVTNIINVANKSATPNDVANKDKSLLGGIVRINEETGRVVNCSNGYIGIPNSSGNKNGAKINSTVGGGGIVGANYGVVEGCVNFGRMGSRANYETGKTVDYSYLGGIVAFNYGTVKESINYGSIFAQRGATSVGNDNKVFGGVVAYNEGEIISCVNSADRIHGDEFIGGIVGINAGTVNSCYVNTVATDNELGIKLQALMIGGRTNIGGIAGDNSKGTITNCYFVDTVNSFPRSYSSAQADANKPNKQGIIFTTEGEGYLIAKGGNISNCVYYKLTNGEVADSTAVTITVAPVGGNNCVSGKPLANDFTAILGSRFTSTGRLIWEK